MVKSTVLGSLAYLLVFTTSCGDPKSKSTRTEVNSADATDDYEDIVAEKPAVISGSHLFCSEEPGVMGEDLVDVVCSIKEDVDFAKYIDKDHLVIEVAGRVVPITIDEKGKFKFSLPKDQEYSTESIKVHDIEEVKSEEVLEDSSTKEEMTKNEDDIDDKSLKSDTSEEPNDDESDNKEEQALDEMNADEEADDEEEEEDKDKDKTKGKDKKSKNDDLEEADD